jgi:hypothetical protein
MSVVRLTTLVVPPRIQQGDQLMGKHFTISPAEAAEAADRLAMRELVEAYDSFHLATSRVEDIG